MLKNAPKTVVNHLENIQLVFRRLGFILRGNDGNEIKKLWAVFRFIRHPIYVHRLNDKLFEQGLRPMAQIELLDFFRTYQFCLSALPDHLYIATAPADIRIDGLLDNCSRLPCIWKAGPDMVWGDARVHRYEGGIVLQGGKMTVIAIDEEFQG